MAARLTPVVLWDKEPLSIEQMTLGHLLPSPLSIPWGAVVGGPLGQASSISCLQTYPQTLTLRPRGAQEPGWGLSTQSWRPHNGGCVSGQQQGLDLREEGQQAFQQPPRPRAARAERQSLLLTGCLARPLKAQQLGPGEPGLPLGAATHSRPTLHSCLSHEGGHLCRLAGSCAHLGQSQGITLWNTPERP